MTTAVLDRNGGTTSSTAAASRNVGLASSAAVKAPCVVAAVSAITLSGLQTIDGVTVDAADRVLVAGQADSKTNGIYEVSTGSWQRAADFNRNDDVVDGTLVVVSGGGTYSGLWAVHFSDDETLFDTTQFVFTKVFGPVVVRGVAFSILLSLPSRALPSTYQTNPTLAAGDVQVSKDGGAYANITTLPSASPAASSTILLSLSATEMTANTIVVRFSDQAGNEWADTLVTLNTLTGAFAITSAPAASAGGSGQTLAAFFPTDNEPPSTNYALFDVRNGRSVLAFDDTTQWSGVFSGIMPRAYKSGGITVYVHSMAATAIIGTHGWTVEIERGDAGGTDFDSNSFAAAATITAATVPGTSGQILVQNVAIASGAAMDSLAAGEPFRLRLKRDVANDTAVGNAQVVMVEVKET